MIKLIKRLLGIESLEHQLMLAHEDLEELWLSLSLERTEHERLKTTLKPIYGEWKFRKDGLGRYRKVCYPNSMSTFRTESEGLSLPDDDEHREYMLKLQMEENGIQVPF